MKQFFKFVLASMLGFFLTCILIIFLFIAIVAAAVSGGDKKEVKVESNSVLHIQFNQKITDRASKNPLENFDFGSFSSEQPLGLDDILKNIKKAKNDDKIKGIYLDISSIPSGIATIEEIRNALLDFKTSKKFIISYSEGYTQGGYYLASVSDELYLHPQGAIEVKGLKAEIMFYKGALEKLEIEPEVIRHGKFKSAIEPYILDGMSDANKEQTLTFMGGIWKHIITGIATQRKITAEEIQNMADKMLVQNAKDAVKYKLADKLLYKDEVLEILKTKSGAESAEKIKFVTLDKYFDSPDQNRKTIEKDKIAVIYATGQIESGEGDDKTIGGERISKAIREARLDPKIKAIVLRVNSPGGSSLASDVIWREVVLARKVKPVVASMGDVAASGGYYISCAADAIVASPNTITGSIGVFGLMFNGQGFLNHKLGIKIDGVKTAEHADIGTIYRPLTADEKAVIQKEVEDVYDDFISHVAEGRKITKAQVDSIGQGRVWSGVDAMRIGLIDEFGGLDKAIELAAKKAKLDKYRVVSLPKQKDPFEKLMSELSGETETFFMKRELGENYKYYKHLQSVLKTQGIQARMPYELEIY